MSLFVIDASVAAKWILPPEGEPLSVEALDLLRRYVSSEIRLIVPDLFWAEMGNILWKAVRQGRLCDKRAAAKALALLRDRKFPTISSLNLIELAFEIAVDFDRTVYDSLYVALAVDANAQFITADDRLANALAGRLPAKWLGDGIRL